jgi:catechol 2,3-dioxygenase-like lactoylglutathione lyase family enzyme
MSERARPRITGYDHVGIRVSDRDRALDFYERLGFIVDDELSNERVAEIVTADGTRVNLIFNGERRSAARNILLDEPVKWPGFTHGAFIVESIQALLDWADHHGVAITEGPLDWGRRLTCFLRDPDGNVLEFNELVSPQGGRES